LKPVTAGPAEGKKDGELLNAVNPDHTAGMTSMAANKIPIAAEDKRGFRADAIAEMVPRVRRIPATAIVIRGATCLFHLMEWLVTDRSAFL